MDMEVWVKQLSLKKLRRAYLRLTKKVWYWQDTRDSPYQPMAAGRLSEARYRVRIVKEELTRRGSDA